MKREEVLDRLRSGMTAMYGIRLGAGEEVLKKGVPGPVVISSKKRQSKFVTLITGLESYGIDPKGTSRSSPSTQLSRHTVPSFSVYVFVADGLDALPYPFVSSSRRRPQEDLCILNDRHSSLLRSDKGESRRGPRPGDPCQYRPGFAGQGGRAETVRQDREGEVSEQSQEVRIQSSWRIIDIIRWPICERYARRVSAALTRSRRSGKCVLIRIVPLPYPPFA
jgi:hypothetical protein